MPKFSDYTAALAINPTDVLLLKQGSSTVKADISQITSKIMESVAPIINSTTVATGGFYTTIQNWDIKNRSSDILPIVTSAENEIILIESITIVRKILKSTVNALADLELRLRAAYTNPETLIEVNADIVGSVANPIKHVVNTSFFEVGYDAVPANASYPLIANVVSYSIAGNTKNIDTTDVYYSPGVGFGVREPKTIFIELLAAPDNFTTDDKCILDFHLVYRKITV